MQKSQKNSEPRDRLSELPDSLIFHIFWFLPMTDVVKTTVLSNRWENLWTTTPYLNFDYSGLYDVEDAVRKFINRALLSWSGVKILKFKIDFSSRSDDSLLSHDFDLWVRFAMEKKVEELYVHRNKLTMDEYYWEAPRYLYSCSSFKVLSFTQCGLHIRGNVQWNSLKSLTIASVCDINFEYGMNQVLRGSPQLEILILTLHDSNGNLSIESSSLKKLSIESLPLVNNWRSLRICTPQLEILEIYGVPYSQCLMFDVFSLTHATLGFYCSINELFYDDNDLWEILRQIVPTIHYVQNVTLSDWCIKVLAVADLEMKSLVSLLWNVKLLKLHATFVEYKQIVGLLENFPKLKKLVLEHQHEITPKSLMFNAESCLEFEASLPESSFLLQLRTVEISWAETDCSMFPFIEIVLKYASNLKNLVIRAQGKPPSYDSLLLASQKLLGMPRSSPNCTLTFL